MERTFKQLKEKVSELESKGIADNTPIVVDVSDIDPELDDYYPNFYYHNYEDAKYIRITITRCAL